MTIRLCQVETVLAILLFSGSLPAAEPAGKASALPPGTEGVPGRPNSRFTGPPPTKTIVYKKVGERELLLHVFEPAETATTAKRPAIIFFHGGAWQIGDPNQFYYQGDYLAKRGMWAASAQYRLTAAPGVRVADCILDAKDAVRYVRSHAAELGVDPARIVASGGSAGGHLAAATALLPEENAAGTVSCKPNLLVLFNPALFHGSAQRTLSLEHFTKDTPPAIYFYGTKDAMLQYGRDCLAQSQRLGFPMSLYAAKGPGHSFFNDSPWRERTLLEVDRFLAKHGYLQGDPTVKAPPRAELDEIKEPSNSP